ncbi:hypothetical protein C1645_775551 [Glomus cerebriforme]|uniref:Uncharacterized protein n=1 Tax=Glomus cerebriforme TaxID=658196 RepID=A0A397SZJ9_9GLOM|nr:hypothetical protein C1645_775551 [Glomus cerebriforme]
MTEKKFFSVSLLQYPGRFCLLSRSIRIYYKFNSPRNFLKTLFIENLVTKILQSRD